MHRSQQLGLAFAVGAICGIAAALISAPSSGEETRRRLNTWGRLAARRARHGVERVRQVASEQADRVGRALDEGRAAYRGETAAVTGRRVEPSGDRSGA